MWLCLVLTVFGVLASEGSVTGPVPAPQGVGSPGPVMLGAQAMGITLDGRSRWWIDESGSFSVDQVEAAGDSLPWKLKQPQQQYRLDGKALWLQFDARVEGEARWFLEIGLSGLDRAQIFHRNADGRWVAQEAGDGRAVSAWPLPGRVPTFELSHHDEQRTTRYWLRVEHARVDFAAPLMLYEQARLFANREREQFLLGAYFGLAAVIALVTLANAVAFRDRSYGSYAVYVSMLALGQAAYLGVGAQHLWDEWLAWNALSTFLLPGLSSAAGLWFVHTITEPARFSRKLDLAVWSLVVALVAAVVLDSLLRSRATLQLTMALILAALVLTVVLIHRVWRHGSDPVIKLVALGFLPVLVMAIFPVLRGLNLIPNSFLTRYGLAVGAMLEMPILFHALSLRGARRRDAQARASTLAFHDPLTGLANLDSLLARVGDAIERARGQKHVFALLAIKLANYEDILDEYGRDAADKALVVAASQLRLAVGETDLVARVGEYEFAIFLEGPLVSTEALSRAQQVVAGGLRQAPALPPGVMLRFQVAVAELPEDDLGADNSLSWTMDALRSIPGDARRAIRAVNF